MNIFLSILKYVPMFLQYVVITWVLYLAVMTLREAKTRAELPPVARFIGTAVFAVGLVNDFVLNVLFCFFVFFEPPRAWLLTATLQRHLKDDPTSYKYKVSKWVCQNLLDPFQTGGHC